MNPSQVRQRILMDHDRMRQRLDAVEASLASLPEHPSEIARVCEAASAMVADFVKHTELEDEILGAALAELDAWGPVRAAILREHHASQRDQLRGLLQAYEAPAPVEHIAHITLSWIREVRADMRHEEHDILASTLLRDDPVAVNMECS